MLQFTLSPRVGSIKVVLVEDDPLVRDTTRRLLACEADIDLLGEAENGQAALDLVQRLRPAVLLLDHGLPGMTGLDVLYQLHAAGDAPRVLIYTGHVCAKLAHLALHSGADGFLAKIDAPRVLAQAVRTVARGETYISPCIRDQVMRRSFKHTASPRHVRLTQQDMQVLRLLADGASIQAIGRHLHISERTVHNRIDTIRAILGVESREEAIAWAAACGFSSFGKVPTTEHGNA